jgi:RNA polymerase sigma factor (sigma-70 family)
MSPTLLHAVIRRADARTPDADLLDRFVRSKDASAFEELVRRHGPLVWAVCRQLLPHHADAEDAFQATFLALVRGAGAIRAGEALPAWLHGVAVRVAARAKRAAARRRQRERRVAVPEADRPVPDSTWASLMAAVHEEVQRLPDAERTAFVLCDLEGVRQPDAAARLGWPLGTLSGRLCKARQRLLEQLSRRGIAPGVLAVGGLAGSAGTVPAALAERVTSFPAATAAGVSSTVAQLARGLAEGATMRTKVLAAALLVAGAIGVTGGAMVISTADAQTGSGSSAGPPAGLPPGSGAPPGTGAGLPLGALGGGGGQTVPAGPGGLLPGSGAGGLQPPGAGGAGAGTVPAGPGGLLSGPGVATGMAPPGMGQGGGSGLGGVWLGGTHAWEYKFVDIKIDRKEFEKVITQHGKDGWEFCGSERFNDGNKAEFVLVFKKPKGGNFPFGGGGGMPGFGEGMGGWGRGGAGGFDFSLPGLGGGGVFGGGGRMGGGGADVENLVHKLKHVHAADVATALEKALSGAKVLKVVAEPVSNTIIIVTDPASMKTARKMIDELDVNPKGGSGGSSLGGPTGGSSGGSSLGPPGGTGPGVGGFRPGSGRPPGGIGPGAAGPTVGGGAPRDGAITVYALKHAVAEELVPVMKKVFPNTDITAEPRTNQLIVRTHDEKAATEIEALIQRLDVQVPKK